MPSKLPPTTIRFTEEDREILEKLSKLTGLTTSGVIRLAIREALDARSKRGKR
jgi:predicted DNA-binding protein